MTQSQPELHVLLIDGLNIIRRVHAGVPGDPESDSHFDACTTASMASLNRAIRRHQPTHAAVVMDGEGESWRKERFPGYKLGRSPMSERLRIGLTDIRRCIEKEGIKTIDADGYEADDTIATMAVRISRARGRVTILSSDKHFGQIVDADVTAYDHFTERLCDAAAVVDRFGVRPDQLATLFALTGDQGVGVSGVRGVGPKTGQALVSEFDNLEAILAAAVDRDDRIGRCLHEQADAAREALEILALRLDVPVGINLKDLRLNRANHPSS